MRLDLLLPCGTFTQVTHCHFNCLFEHTNRHTQTLSLRNRHASEQRSWRSACDRGCRHLIADQDSIQFVCLSPSLSVCLVDAAKARFVRKLWSLRTGTWLFYAQQSGCRESVVLSSDARADLSMQTRPSAFKLLLLPTFFMFALKARTESRDNCVEQCRMLPSTTLKKAALGTHLG